MDARTWALGAAVVLLALGVLVLLVLVVRLSRSVRELRAAGPATAPLVRRAVEHAVPAAAADPEFVITRVGEALVVPGPEPVVAPDRVVLSATLGEPLVKVVAFGHGLRRALSAESRNRIGFEVRREVRRSRKERRREMRQAWRTMKAEREQARRADLGSEMGRDVA